jgi:hypothetical protein
MKNKQSALTIENSLAVASREKCHSLWHFWNCRSNREVGRQWAPLSFISNSHPQSRLCSHPSSGQVATDGSGLGAVCPFQAQLRQSPR